MEYKRYIRGTKGAGWGDRLASFTEATGIKKTVEVAAKAVGIKDCGCAKRQEQLNELGKKIMGK